MIRKVSAEDIAIRGNGTGMEYMCPTRHFVYIFFNPVFQVSTAKNEINLFNNHVLIVAPVTFAPAGAMTPSAEFLFLMLWLFIYSYFLHKIQWYFILLILGIHTAQSPEITIMQYHQDSYYMVWDISRYFLGKYETC